MRVFNERGYDATSMEDLSRALGITKSAIYHHVSSKEDLLRIATGRALDGLFGVAAEAEALPGRAVDRLEYLIRGSLAVLAAQLPFVTLLLRVHGNTQAERETLARRRDFDRLTAALVKQAVAEGDLRADIDPALTARLLFGLVNSVSEWYRPRQGDDGAVVADAIRTLAFDGLRNLLGQPRLFRQFCPGLLRHHVPGVPVGPVRIGRPDALFVLAMGDRRAPHRVSKVARGVIRRRRRIDAPGQPGRDFLQQPAIAVRIAERGERAVAAMIGRGTADAVAGAVRTEPRARRPLVEHLADLGAAAGELASRGIDVGDCQVQVLGRTGRGRRQALAELDRAPGAGRRELDDAEAAAADIGVEPPAEPPVELLRPVGIRDGDDDHFELRIHHAAIVRLHGRAFQ